MSAQAGGAADRWAARCGGCGRKGDTLHGAAPPEAASGPGRRSRIPMCESARWLAWRSRGAPSSGPASASSSGKLSAYVHSIRPRTASAACRSNSPSMNCRTLTSAKRQGASAGCPWVRDRSVKWSSVERWPMASRIRIVTVACRNAPCALRAVSSGTGGTGSGLRDMRRLPWRQQRATLLSLILRGQSSLFPPLRLRQQEQLHGSASVLWRGGPTSGSFPRLTGTGRPFSHERRA